MRDRSGTVDPAQDQPRSLVTQVIPAATPGQQQTVTPHRQRVLVDVAVLLTQSQQRHTNAGAIGDCVFADRAQVLESDALRIQTGCGVDIVCSQRSDQVGEDVGRPVGQFGTDGRNGLVLLIPRQTDRLPADDLGKVDLLGGVQRLGVRTGLVRARRIAARCQNPAQRQTGLGVVGDEVGVRRDGDLTVGQQAEGFGLANLRSSSRVGLRRFGNEDAGAGEHRGVGGRHVD